MGFDWASDSYLADALDAAEDRAERAEAYLAEQSSGRSNILNTIGSSVAGAGTAGLLAYLSQTAFKQDGKPGMPHIGPLPMTIPIGILFKAAALMGWHEKLGLPEGSYQYVDSMGQGMLDHAAVMFGLEMGKEASDAGAKSKGTKDWEHAKHAYVEGNRAWEAARKGYVRGNEPAQVGATSSSHAPENYMTADQLRVWQSYSG